MAENSKLGRWLSSLTKLSSRFHVHLGSLVRFPAWLSLDTILSSKWGYELGFFLCQDSRRVPRPSRLIVWEPKSGKSMY